MFEWDEKKSVVNLQKHGVDFSLAVEIFSDPKAVVQFSREIDGEKRYQIIGSLAGEVIVLLVVFVQRKEKIRVISARKASKKERLIYGQKATN